MLHRIIGRRPDLALLILRFAVGIVFLQHGIAKFQMGIENVAKYFISLHIPLAGFFAWIVAIVETFGGLGLILGFGTMVASLLISIDMLVAIFTAKAGKPLIGGFELELTLLAANLALLFSGSGRYSLEHLWKKVA